MDAHSLALAYSLSSVSGLRASLTILALSIAIRWHLVAPPPALGWVGADQTLIVVAILAALDFFADKVPVVDHAVHLVHSVAAPFAGGLAAATVDPSGGSIVPWVAAAGGANALGVLGVRATARAGSSATSAGMLNPLVSLVEDLLAAAGLVLAFAAPYVAAVAALIVTVLALLLGRTLWRTLRRSAAAPR